MTGILKGFIRVTVILAIVGAGAAVIAGPDRVGAMISQVQDEVHTAIDAKIEDPVALRRQLTKMEREYPERIAAVRSDLNELNQQIQDLEQERQISVKVVELASEDLGRYEARLDGASPASYSEQANLRTLERKVHHVEQTMLAHNNRALDAERDLGYLYKQAERMEELLADLELEHAEFVTQIQQLERQIDAVARNDRLIEMIEEREKTIEEMSRHESYSLGHIQSRLATIRSEQEAHLEVLSTAQEQTDYEDRARFELEQNAGAAQAPSCREIPGGLHKEIVPAF